MIDSALLLDIRETHRQQRDLMRTAKKVENQIGSICRRHTGEVFRGKEGSKKVRVPSPIADALQKECISYVRANRRFLKKEQERERKAMLWQIENPDKKAKALQPLKRPADLSLEALQLFPFLEPFIVGFLGFEESSEAQTRMLEERATQLPVYVFVQQVKGLGAHGLAQIIGECGDLSNYATPPKLWTRMCVGRRQNLDGSWSNQGFTADGSTERGKGDFIKKNLDAEGRFVHWYNAERRSLLFVICDSLIKGNGGEYKALYDAQKAAYIEKWQLAKPGRAHYAALRYLGKRLLKHLWIVWRAIERGESLERYTVERLFAGDTQRFEA